MRQTSPSRLNASVAVATRAAPQQRLACLLTAARPDVYATDATVAPQCLCSRSRGATAEARVLAHCIAPQCVCDRHHRRASMPVQPLARRHSRGTRACSSIAPQHLNVHALPRIAPARLHLHIQTLTALSRITGDYLRCWRHCDPERIEPRCWRT